MGELVPAASNNVARPHPGWKPGQSGNPRGRPKTPFDLPALCRSHTPEAIEKLVEIMRGDDTGKALTAIQMLLDRGYGRPITPVVTNDQPESLSLLHLIAARRVAEALEAMAQKANESGVPDSGQPAVIDYSVPALE